LRQPGPYDSRFSTASVSAQQKARIMSASFWVCCGAIEALSFLIKAGAGTQTNLRDMKLRALAFMFASLLTPLIALAAQPVPPFPAPPTLPTPQQTGYVSVNGVKIWYGTFGSGPSVVLIEGGLDTTDDWGYLAPSLAAHHYRAIVFDSRCQGRSTCSNAPLSYELMASDTIGVMNALHVHKAPIVGYSDGGIIGLILAFHDPSRVASVFAYGANSKPNTLVNPTPAEVPVDNASEAWSERVYRAQSPTPDAFKAVEKRIAHMWDTQPHLMAQQLRTISAPVWIVDGDRDMIKRSDSDFMAHAMPLGQELILPGASHYALWQYPTLFNTAVLQFLNHP
jgi:pimeloyl-ACP methyl ester carboxylesterase